MRPPWTEAAALLAAHHHPAAIPADLYRRRPVMPADARYAVLSADPAVKPRVFPDLEALARHIQRERGLQALELVETEDLEIQGDPQPRRAVTVFTLDAANDRDRLIGHAYLDGRGRETLQAALRRNRLVLPADMQDAA